MAAPHTVRMSLLLCAAGLAACNSLPRSLTLVEGQPTTITLSLGGPLLSLQNESFALSQPDSPPVPMQKIVRDAEMQSLFDVFTAEQLFEHSVASSAGNSRDFLRIDSGGRSWIWARRGSFTDPREAAFRQCSNYFLALYNSSLTLQTTDRPDFRAQGAEAQRKAAAARARLEGLRGDGR
jgi:hypothetical protein